MLGVLQPQQECHLRGWHSAGGNSRSQDASGEAVVIWAHISYFTDNHLFKIFPRVLKFASYGDVLDYWTFEVNDRCGVICHRFLGIHTYNTYL